MKRILCVLLTFVLLLSLLPAQALAETFTVDSRQDMASSWEQANQNQDASNTFNMTQNIDMGSQQLNTQSGKTYVINGNGHTISNVDINGVDSKQETVTIKANVSSQDHTALEVTGNVDVNVTGNVTNVSNSSKDANDSVIVAGNGADLTIRGNVSSEESGINANGAERVVVTGNVKLESENGVDPLNPVVKATDTTVEINGRVTSEEGGLFITDSKVTISGNVETEGQSVLQEDASVVIKGNFRSEPGKEMDEFSGVYVDDSYLQVNRDMEAPVAFVQNDSTVRVSGTLQSQYVVLGVNSVSGDESGITIGTLKGNVDAGSDINVTVNQDATGDLDVRDSAEVTIKGNLTGDVSAIGNGAEVSVGGNVTSDDATVIMGGASLHVDGNLKNTSTGTDSGVTVINNSEIFVGKTTTASQVSVLLDSKADFGDINSSNVQVGSSGNLEDDTTFRSGNIHYYYIQNGFKKDKGNLYAYGNSHSTVWGDVGNTVRANDKAIVNVYGGVPNLSVTGNGFAQKNLGKPKATNVTNYYPTVTTSNDKLVALCKGYAMGSQMYKHCDTLFDIMQESKTEMDKHLNVFTGFVGSVTEWPTVLKNKFFSAGTLTQEDLASYNSGSLSKLKGASKLNTYYVEVYKSHLADALEEVEGENQAKADRKQIKKIADIIGKLGEIESAGSTSGMSKDAQNALKSITKDHKLTPEEALDFLVEYGYYSDTDEELSAAARRMTDMFEYKKTMEATGKTVKLIFTAADFAEYWGTNFEDEVLMLDAMLDNQTMEPEMFVAVAELRKEYANKHYGIAKKFVEVIRDQGLGYLGKLASDIAVAGPILGAVSLVQSCIEVTAFVTGISGDVDARNKGAALSAMLPAAYENYVSAIENIRDGDDSEEALQLVENSFLLFKGMLMEMSEANLKLCPSSRQHIYEYYRDMLGGLEAGSTEW